MRQLSDTDYLMLASETNSVYMHVASLSIYDPSSAPNGHVRFKDILRFVSSRIEAEPIFRRRLVTVPLSLDLPYWVDDREIDVEHHVRHIALPHPGDWRQLCIQVARLHSRPLDRSKPLWEMYVIEGLDRIEGLPRGSFAVYTKLHHSAIDGVGATPLLKAMNAESPEEMDTLRHTTVYADREPTFIELGARALLNKAKVVPALLTLGVEAARMAGEFAASNADKLSARGVAELGRKLVKPGNADEGAARPPVTRFNAPISPHRVVEAAAIDLAEIKTVRQHVPGVTVNDVFLAVVSGALRKYLESKGELPEASMQASVPVSLRTAANATEEGNHVGIMLVPMHTEIADPVARLEAIRDSSATAKKSNARLGKGLAAAIHKLFPVDVSIMLANHVLSQTNVMVSNVRGPDQAWYLAGARLERFVPISVLYDGAGLNITGFSLSGTLWISALSCRKMMPDPSFFADCMRASFAELRDAALASRPAVAPVSPSRGRRSKRRRASPG